MKRIFIVRHGKTQWNLEQRLQGAGADSPLVLTDMRPYTQLAAYLNTYHFTHVYASPLQRARHTGALVTERLDHVAQPGLVIEPGLTEISFGQWEGQSRADIVATQPELFAKLSQRRNDPGLTALGVEDFTVARKRFAAAVNKIAAGLNDNENALIFAHGGITQIGIKELTGNEHLLGLKNLSTSILAVRADGMYIDVYNQTAYLDNVDLNEGNVSIM